MRMNRYGSDIQILDSTFASMLKRDVKSEKYELPWLFIIRNS